VNGGLLMTAAVIPAGIVPRGPAWRSLLWLIPLTVLWIVLIYWQPFIPASGVPSLALELMVHGIIAVGLWLGLEGTDLTPSQRRTTWLAVMIPNTLWFAITWSAAIDDVFVTGASRPPFLPLAIFLPVIIGAPLLLLSKRVGQVLDAMPVSWLVALQLYRVFGGWFLAAWLRGALPGVRTGDGHSARSVPGDRSGFAELQPRRLSRCADPRFRGAKLDPPARAVATPAAPARLVKHDI
jgi:hypothetical protein